MNRILITGATGRAGRQVVSQLLAMRVRVRALARNPDAAGMPPQVEVVRGDLTLPQTLDECLDGIDAVFLVWCASAASVSASDSGSVLSPDRASNARPEFAECVARHAARETPPDSRESVPGVGFARHTPRVRHEVIARNGRVPRVRRHGAAISAASQKCHPDNLADAPGERPSGGAGVPRILAPHRAEACLHRVARHDTGQAHAVAFSEAVPMRAVFAREVQHGSPARADDAAGQAGGTDRTADKPFHAPLRIDWSGRWVLRERVSAANGDEQE